MEILEMKILTIEMLSIFLVILGVSAVFLTIYIIMVGAKPIGYVIVEKGEKGKIHLKNRQVTLSPISEGQEQVNLFFKNSKWCLQEGEKCKEISIGEEFTLFGKKFEIRKEPRFLDIFKIYILFFAVVTAVAIFGNFVLSEGVFTDETSKWSKEYDRGKDKSEDDSSGEMMKESVQTISLKYIDSGFIVNAKGMQAGSKIDETNIKSNQIIATDEEDNKYTLKSLSGKRVCVYYGMQKDGKNYDCFFAGQFNEDGIWNGKCLINTYLEGELEMTSEDVYKNGKRKKYEQVYKAEHDWVYGKRKVKDDGTFAGDTWEYSIISGESINQKISRDNPQEDDMMTPETIINNFSKKKRNPRLWYHGKTNGSTFSDISGKAFQVAFHTDGTVKTFYVGEFQDGPVNGWELAKDDVEWDFYIYYKGIFSSNQHILADSPNVKEIGRYYSWDEIDERIGHDLAVNASELSWGILRDEE